MIEVDIKVRSHNGPETGVLLKLREKLPFSEGFHAEKKGPKKQTFFGVAEVNDDDSSTPLGALFLINLTISNGHVYWLNLLVFFISHS